MYWWTKTLVNEIDDQESRIKLDRHFYSILDVVSTEFSMMVPVFMIACVK